MTVGNTERPPRITVVIDRKIECRFVEILETTTKKLYLTETFPGNEKVRTE